MPNDLRISANELKQRMQAGEAFTILDARNPNAWGEAQDKARGAMRMSVDAGEQELNKLPRGKPIVTYCT